MSQTKITLEVAANLEDLAEFYNVRTIDLVYAGKREKQEVATGNLKPGTIGHTRTVAGPAAYEAAKRCKELADRLVEAHADLVAATREWERVR